MAIAKMKLVNIDGDIRQLDAAVLKCSYGNNFHPEQASMYYESMGAIQTYNEESPYTSLLRRITEIGMHAGIDLSAENAQNYYAFNLNYIDDLPAKIHNIKRYSFEVRELIEELEGKPAEKGDIYHAESLKFRFGRMPIKSYKKLKKTSNKNFIFYPLQTDKGFQWGVCITSKIAVKAVDKQFVGLNFERIGVPRDIFLNPDGIKNYGKSDIEIDRDSLIGYIDSFDADVLALNQRRVELSERITRNEQALIQLNHIEGLDIPFDDIFSCKFIKVRFGRLPVDSYNKLSYYDDKPFMFYTFDNDEDYHWGVYFVPNTYAAECDGIFNSLYYERLYIPDTVHGTPEQSRAQLTKVLREDKDDLAEVLGNMKALVNRRKLYFYEVFARIKFLSDAFDLRKYISVMDETFHIVGFVPESEAQAFKQTFESLEGVTATIKPCDSDLRFSPPTKLKNNHFFKPFEMFVDMFGLPSYSDIDPTVFVGITYTFLFGLMFGDVGQGLCISLLGLILWRTKRMKLGKIMERIGISSAFFGVLYGSVFGYENLLDPFYKDAFGLDKKPIEILAPEMTNYILLGAVAIGVLIIITAIIINIIMGIKQKSFSRALLSHNGLAGLVFYCTVLCGAVLNLVYKINIFNPVVVVAGILLPILLIFFKEPIAKRIQHYRKRPIGKPAKSGNETATMKMLHNEDINTPICQILDCKFLKTRFGRLPKDSYEKLRYYDEKLFVFYVTEIDHDYYWGVYFTPYSSAKEVDSIFLSLYFERLKLPSKLDGLSTESLADISKLMRADIAEVQKASGKKAKVKDKEAVGFGAFFIESFFELFEVMLSFITNTMSFLRVGGFILSHAGMMAVVMTLAEMVGAGASPVVVIIGNVFVMAMEGLIVGIQVLRLEFYEMFSRFFEGDGKPFAPITVGAAEKKED